MKKFVGVLIALLIVCSFVSAENIGENYEEGGVVLGGSGYFYTNLEGYRSLFLSPWLEFLIAEGVVLGAEVSIYTNSTDDFEVGLSPYVGVTFGYDPDASSGPAHNLSVSGGLTFSRDAFGSLPTTGSLVPSYTFYYFITPRLAPYAQLTALTVNLGGGVDVSTYLRIRFGMSFHMPNRDRIISETK